MKSHEEIKKDLKKFSGVFGFNPNDINQGDDEWRQMKLGVISASNAVRACGSKTVRATYMRELLAQIFTKEMPDVKAKPMEWGHMHEDAARALYELEIKKPIVEYPFMFKDETMRVGASPDGIIHSIATGNEIKCPFTTPVHIDLMINEKIKKDYEFQIQHSMYVTGADTWHFCSYDPRMTVNQLIVKIVDRNDEFMNLFDDAYAQFSYDMDKILKSQGVEFGSQWSLDEYKKLQG